MALPALDSLWFQDSEAETGAARDLCSAGLIPMARSWKPRLLPTCEKIFIAGSEVRERVLKPKLASNSKLTGSYQGWHLLFSTNYPALLAICTTAFLLCVLPLCASDVQAPPDDSAKGGQPTANPVPVESPNVSDIQDQTKKSGKYDINRIGQRGIGKGVNLYSLERERALGQAMAAAIERRTKFVADPDVNEYVNRLGQKIARNSDAEILFTIRVIDSLELKAFSLPGGFLYVDKGLIMEVDSEAELAAMMAREIAHVAARHGSRSATRLFAWNMFSLPLIYLGGPAGLGVRQVAGIGVPLSFKKFSRDAEIEADLLGIEYQYAAGYDPQAFLEALEKLQSKENQRHGRTPKLPVLNFLAKLPLHDQIAHAYANYPSTEERIRRAQTEISTLLPNRNDYVLDTSEFQEIKAKLAWADRPILRRHRSADGLANGPVLRKRLPQEPQER